MLSQQSQIASCAACAQTCKSIIGRYRQSGSAIYDQFRYQYDFRSGQNMPFSRNGRVGFFCIASGYVRLNCKSGCTYRAVRISGPGDIVGYVNFLSSNYTATAIDAVTACFFDLEIFFMLQSQTPELSRSAIKWLCELITVRDERILTLGSRTAKAKVASTFLSLAKKFGQTGHDGSIRITPTIDRRTLAELSGTVMETFSRVVTE